MQVFKPESRFLAMRQLFLPNISTPFKYKSFSRGFQYEKPSIPSICSSIGLNEFLSSVSFVTAFDPSTTPLSFSSWQVLEGAIGLSEVGSTDLSKISQVFIGLFSSHSPKFRFLLLSLTTVTTSEILFSFLQEF
jgi:hypothetical protein